MVKCIEVNLFVVCNSDTISIVAKTFGVTKTFGVAKTFGRLLGSPLAGPVA
jgi:hypothetical protein